MEITRGVIKGAQKIIIDGPEGIGKTSLAAMFPNCIFIDTEGSTKHIDVARTPNPSSWTMLLEQIKYFKLHPDILDSLVVDTGDWAETLCINHICSTYGKNGIEDFGYGKGYVYLEEEFGRFLNLLNDLVELGINVIIVAHVQMRKFEQPDEMGAYDRWELKLEKKTAPLLKEWADMQLFINYKTYVVSSGDNGKGAKKAQGGKRVIYTSHHPCWDAKNRHGLPEELPFGSPEEGWKQIAHCIPPRINKPVSKPMPEPQRAEEVARDLSEPEPTKTEPVKTEAPKQDQSRNTLHDVPKALADLMIADSVTVEDIQKVVAKKGYYPEDTPISNYDPNFINGVLVGAWDQVFKAIKGSR
jgi:hypothetical protein